MPVYLPVIRKCSEDRIENAVKPSQERLTKTWPCATFSLAFLPGEWGQKIMAIKREAVAYYRTSSAANVGDDKDSLPRQQEAVRRYAAEHGLEIVDEFYDAAVSGGDPIDGRPAFVDMLRRTAGNGVRVILIESPDRFARDLLVQLAGEGKLKALGVDLIPVSAPTFFEQDTPTAKLIRGVLGAVAEFEKASLVARLRAARDRKRMLTGRCEGRPKITGPMVDEVRRLARRNPKTGRTRSLRQISAELAKLGYLNEKGKPLAAQSVRNLLGPRP